MTALTATLSNGESNTGSGISSTYHLLNVPMDQSQHLYSMAGSGTVSLVKVFGFLPAGRSVQILVGTTEVFFVPALATDSILDVKNFVGELAARLVPDNTNLTINFGTTGAVTQRLQIVVSPQFG